MREQIPLAISLNAQLTFEHFYITAVSRPIVDELKRFGTEAHSEPFLYLWGASGSGVTHLLNAVLHASPHLSTQYLPLKSLLMYPAEVIIQGVDDADLVCIDNIEQLVNEPAWQESVFHLFNRLRDGGKKLLVGGQVAPGQLDIELSDLKSRLQWGLTLYLPSLDDGDKKQAMQAYAQQVGLSLSGDVADFMMQRCDRSTPSLFALMEKLDRASMAEHRKLTIPFVKSFI